MIWVLVDLSWVMHRALHTVGGLEHEDVPTGLIYGFFHQLRQICNDPKVNSNRIAIFCDSRQSLRRDAYPAYKRKREEQRTPEEQQQIRMLWDQRRLLERKLLPAIGFPVYRQKGLESDDLMAWCARELSIPDYGAIEGLRKTVQYNAGRQAVMITADGDLYQCVTDQVHWFDAQRDIYHTPETFLAAKGVPAHQWGRVKAIGGCQTDNVSGVPGVGEATAVKWLQGGLPPRYKSAMAIVNGRKTIERNTPLVVLPHPKTRPVRLVEPDYDVKAFFRMCRRYGLASFLREREAWRSFFGARRFRVRRRGEA